MANLNKIEAEKLKELEKLMEDPKTDVLAPEQLPDFSTFDVATREEALSKVAVLLAQPERRKMMSELSKEQIMLLACIFAVAEGLKNDYPEISATLERFANEYLELMISYGRKGRKEIMKVASSLSMEYERRSLLGRINPLNWGRG